MNLFYYEARDTEGRPVTGERKGASRQDVYAWLRQQQLTPISITEAKAEGNQRGTVSHSLARKRVKSAELSEFCWQLATMLEGGVPLIDAVKTIADDIDNLYFRSVLQRVIDTMEGGQPFSESVTQFPHVFDAIFQSLINAGESGGALTTTLQRLGNHYAEKDKLRRKIKTAMSYPIFVLSFIVLILIAVMTFIIPRFRTIFDEFDGELPAFTQMFIGVYDFIMAQAVWGVSLVIITAVGCVLWNRTETGHRQFSRFWLKFPMIGRIIQQAFFVLFCRTLSTLLVNGVSVLEAFAILSGMTRNDVIKDAITRTRDHILEGASISSSMAASGFFPNLAVKMAQVGEESGSMPSVMDRTSEHFERKVEGTITTMTSMLEPILIVTVGAIVLVIVLALYLPIFSISDI